MSRKKLSSLFLILILASAMAVTAQMRQPTSLVIPFSGTIEGQVDDVQMIFKLYNQPSGGTPVFTETQTVSVSDGSFSLFIGNQTASGVPPTVFSANKSTYIAFALASDPEDEIGARVPVASSGYAHVALTSAGIIPGTTVSGETASTPGILNVVNTGAGAALVARSSSGTGIFGATSSTGSDPAGVFGVSTGATGTAPGVLGISRSTGSGVGVLGFATGSSNPGSNSVGVMGFAPNGYGVQGQTNDPNKYGLLGIGANQTGNAILALGNLRVTGTKNAVVSLENGEKVALYAVESPEVWFEDFGHGQLLDGVAVVELDKGFLNTVNTAVPYQVFLTPNGDCQGLYVAQKTLTSFEIRELMQGRSNISFDYRIVAKRKGFEERRLEKVDVPSVTKNKIQ